MIYHIYPPVPLSKKSPVEINGKKTDIQRNPPISYVPTFPICVKIKHVQKYQINGPKNHRISFDIIG
jgi:hypothetical protein